MLRHCGLGILAGSHTHLQIENFMPLDKYRAANRANWDERAAIHFASTSGNATTGYNIQRYIDEPGRLSETVTFDRTELGEVAGKSLLHLQCHIGTDTLSWARLGADVTGIDISEKSIQAARRLLEMTGTPGRFIEAELYDAPTVLAEQFDIVYTGVGAICWLPDISEWARVVSKFLKPGGTFYIREGHPMMWSIDQSVDDDLRVIEPYFNSGEPLVEEEEQTYAGDGRIDSRTTYNWAHSLGDTVTALIDAGLTIEFMHEHKFCDWQGIPHLKLSDDGMWRMPDREQLVPLTFSIKATRTS